MTTPECRRVSALPALSSATPARRRPPRASPRRWSRRRRRPGAGRRGSRRRAIGRAAHRRCRAARGTTRRAGRGRRPPRGRRGLTPYRQAWIRSADTFFVATRSAAGDADASHRGGNPGFVQVLGDTELRWPDYTGNAMMMTLGNLRQDPAAGLLFVDRRDGSTLQLTGTATVDWGASDERPGAERVVRFRLRRAVQTDHASPRHPQDSRWARPGSAVTVCVGAVRWSG
nr:pyridoxamine 5'-phosphate oxidase family protein [Geodermatophilus pulveris]